MNPPSWHRADGSDGDAKVSSCIMEIIHAFQNGLNIFKRLRERRKKRRPRKGSQAPDPTTSAELQLSKSLRRGPEELTETYAQCYYSGMGPQFAKGDSIAHASLAETLIKLNTGLVGIIATFLNRDLKNSKSRLHLDYGSLIDLSEASRREALHSMAQLYQRLSPSQLQLHAPTCSRCGTSSHIDCSSDSKFSVREQRKHAGSRQRADGSVVTRMPIKTSSHPQLVVMRPKSTRKNSSLRNNSSASKPPPNSTYATTAMSSVISKFIVMTPIELPASSVIKGTMGVAPPSPRSPRIDSFDDPRPSRWPYNDKGHASEHIDYPRPQLTNFKSTPKHCTPSSERESAHRTSPPISSSPVKRRMDKVTPSSYTFASDSTKLGEIPQFHWTRPWDYEEAERLNSEAALNPQPAVTMPVEKTVKKKGLFRKILSRGSAAGVAVKV
ncbi:hypothetical protein LEMA_P094280.1 [Plenodomus lingam JN3]|uniref:Uncharacterized protein n=2 Tax=Leptosphaeria maculans TaxID=5022 RepID=E5A306_LEPMJ|nr:hypothetical protein LEMA_P094280.1 [Plenodomus lingam JN3]CBX98019.1 hypothetical protein LEMA_P094280.1 [Plenodomus lingam JN3]